ncbi:MAG TPA: phage minor head protein [Burkholderiaceae bacterium]|nr:phage minor head protein [Burkholderiaceae bacterium]
MSSLPEQFADRHADILAHSRGLERDAAVHIVNLSGQVAAILAGTNLARLSRRQTDSLIAKVVAAIESKYGVIAGATNSAVVAMMAATFPNLARQIGSRKRTPPAIDAVLVLGQTVQEAWKTAASSTAKAVVRELRMSIAAERAVADGLFAKKGVFEKSAKNARLVTQAEVLAAETAVKKAAATETSLISGFRWSSMFDSKTCLVCAAMDGELFDLNMVAKNPDVRAVGASPAHGHCRCNMIPELAEDGPASAIPGPDGKVSRGMDFEEWIGKKSKRYQEAYFGPGRYALWKRGDITLNDLMNGQGRIITLAELRAKYGE